MDKAQKPEETVLSPSDFANVPDKELDLRQFGIHVPDDPTMGDKTEGDIAVPDLKRFMDEGTGIQRSAIRQPYR